MAWSGFSLIGCKMKISKSLFKMHSKKHKRLEGCICKCGFYADIWMSHEHKQMKQKCRQSVEKSKSSVHYSSVLLVTVKACNMLSSFFLKKPLSSYNVVWANMWWTLWGDIWCSCMRSFEDFAVLQRKQKLCSLCIKLLTYKCKPFVCT